ncbi:hypothetical protein KDA_36130 [Dictyobacter alpinus]|uniref:ATP-binding protein n=1 Tax=Dictyobacter alpinus TaxID=2014873 RepID=A0A402BA10_9CHLR|nr:ATP-binding protein [Dictyobacter alpinus]GCE28129.1 hypothetical protein KDA_36130 [Dictyobacter alpinus]
MDQNNNTQRINIRPGVSILSVLRHLNYKPWFALAEFVDNSLQSFFDYRQELEEVSDKQFKLKISIELDPADEGQIIIRDNAAGIHMKDFTRAFRPAAIPPNQNGLSEFGMGMKSAACWFADQWTVRTSALNEETERLITFDIGKIVHDDIEELTAQSQMARSDTHYTEITLSKLHKKPQKRTIAKIKEHLASIYRIFIRENVLELRFNGELLTYTDPVILSAPFYKNLHESPRLWKKNLDFDFGLGLRVYGFAALRERGSTSSAGFGLFRRDRIIEGSADEGYRPEYIFGHHNSFVYQRLFGELHIEGFEVSHTKDGFRWEEHEEIFLEYLKKALNEEPLPLLDQAEGHRTRPKPQEIIPGAEVATARTADVIEKEIPQVLEQQIKALPDTQNPPISLPSVTKASQRVINIELNGNQWQIILELSNDPSVGDWVSIYDQLIAEIDLFGSSIRRLGVRLALAHPFTESFGGVESARIEPLLRIAVAIALAETSARDSGVKMAGTIRRNINELLRNALFKID